MESGSLVKLPLLKPFQHSCNRLGLHIFNCWLVLVHTSFDNLAIFFPRAESLFSYCHDIYFHRKKGDFLWLEDFYSFDQSV